MADLTNERLTPQKSETVPRFENFGLAANTNILKGEMVGIDSAGHVVKASAATCVKVLGKAAFGVDNTTPPSGQAKNSMGLDGLAGSGSLQIDYGVNGWDNSATNPLAASDVPCPVFVENDHTISKSQGAGLLAGVLCGVGDEKGGGDKQAYALMGPHGLAIATALLAAAGTDASQAPYTARAVVTTLQAYGGSGTDTLTETANGAISAADGVTLAVNDVVFIQGGTANLTDPKDSGPWVVSALGGAAAKWVLVRPSWWKTGAVMPIAATINIGGEGTAWAGTAWRSFAAVGSAVIGTNDPTFYVGRVTLQVTLVAGTIAVTTVGIRSASKSEVTAELVTKGGTTTSTVGYGTIAALTPGYAGIASATVDAIAAGQTLQNADTSTLNVLVTNW
jgi:hypothetical protein